MAYVPCKYFFLYPYSVHGDDDNDYCDTNNVRERLRGFSCILRLTPHRICTQGYLCKWTPPSGKAAEGTTATAPAHRRQTTTHTCLGTTARTAAARRSPRGGRTPSVLTWSSRSCRSSSSSRHCPSSSPRMGQLLCPVCLSLIHI